MDIRNALASQSYATAKTAVAPAPKQGGVEGGFAQMAGNFANTLMQGEQTARAAMTGGGRSAFAGGRPRLIANRN